MMSKRDLRIMIKSNTSTPEISYLEDEERLQILWQNNPLLSQLFLFSQD